MSVFKQTLIVPDEGYTVTVAQTEEDAEYGYRYTIAVETENADEVEVLLRPEDMIQLRAAIGELLVYGGDAHE